MKKVLQTTKFNVKRHFFFTIINCDKNVYVKKRFLKYFLFIQYEHKRISKYKRILDGEEFRMELFEMSSFYV